jgi:hypothetical protein
MVRQAVLRPAIITGVNVSHQTCSIKLTDRAEDRAVDVVMPHPMASTGWGILATPTSGTRVLVDFQQNERPQIVSVVPSNIYSQSFDSPLNLGEISVDEAEYPRCDPGDIALQSPAGSNLCLFNDGRIQLVADRINVEYSPEESVVSETFGSRYVNTDSHREIIGCVKRDRREGPKSIESILEKLRNVNADRNLETIGRNPDMPVEPLTVNPNQANESLRNPALVEKRSLVYEYARSAMVQDHKEEVSRLLGEDRSFLTQNNRRDMARTDTLNLGLHLPNNLIERTEGTVVDIYGNILDLNRNVIKFSDYIRDEEIKNVDKRIFLENTLMRRSIKYHFEVNARKEALSEATTDTLDGFNATDAATFTGHSHSRFSLDIDGEGLLKFNVPASSNVGNIPLLSRYSNANNPDDRNSWEFRNNPRIDVLHMGFGEADGAGIDIPNIYAPDNILNDGNAFKYRTAYHDILATAADILIDTGEPPLSEDIENTIDFGGTQGITPNAGGRSVHGNLDGSVELNIGRDVVDRKSLVLDAAGSMISRWGKDLQGNSLVSQTDGNVLMQVGGDMVKGETITENNSLSLFVKNGSSFHKIELKEEGIFITSAPNTNLVLSSSRNLILSAKGETLVHGESLFLHGTYDDNGNEITGERLVNRSGKELT